MARPYKEVRKDYINARVEVLLKTTIGTRNRRDLKEVACGEFDELVQEQRQIAVNEALAEHVAAREGLTS